jgi:hypothetical protein
VSLFLICVYSCALVVENKKPTAAWQWVDKFRERSKPDCRAGQQRVRKQQV